MITSDELARIARRAGLVAVEQLAADAEHFAKGGQGDFATAADLASEAVIRNALDGRVDLLSEEDAEGRSGSLPVPATCVIADPFDGTIVGSRGASEWAVAVALKENGVLQHGVSYQPEVDRLVVATAGSGCTVDGVRRVIQPRPAGRLVLGFDISFQLTERHVDGFLRPLIASGELSVMRALGSSVAGAVDVVLGRADAYVHFCGKIWDFAASAVFVREAGGVVMKPDGSPMSWDTIEMPALFARDAAVAKRVMRLCEGM